MGGDRPQVGEKSQLFANLEQPRLGPSLRPRIVPLRPANRTQQDCLRRAALNQRALRQRIAELIDRTAADRAGHEVEAMAKPLSYAPQHALGLGDDLRSDPVAG